MLLEILKARSADLRLLDHVHDSVVAFDLDGRILSWNRGAERLHGYTAQEAIGQHVGLLCAEHDAATGAAAHLAAALQSDFEEYDSIGAFKGGSPKPIHIRVSLIRDDAGEPAGFLSFAIDNSELHSARAQLVERERVLRTILDSAPVRVAYVDTDQRFVFASRGFDALTRHPGEIMIGRRVAEVFPAFYAELRPHVEKALSGTALTTQHQFTRHDGDQRTENIERIPDLDSEGRVRGYFAVVTDITETRRAFAANVEYERRLREALISDVHHRVKNSLQGIVGLLRAQTVNQPALSEAMQPAISQLLSATVGFGLLSKPGRKGVAVCDMAREISRNLSEVTHARIATTVDDSISAEAAVVGPADAVNLGLILNELIVNAIKHSREPGSVPQVEITISHEADAARISVFNPHGQLPQGFEFSSGAGLGTGLNLVRLLLPQSCSLTFEARGEGVLARLVLAPGTYDLARHAA